MRRRWRWPILDSLRNTEVDDWVGAWITWIAVAGLVILLPGMIVDTNGSGDVYLGTYLRDALIVWGIPVALGVLVAVVVVLVGLGRQLVPRRVTEPVREDLRTVERR